MAVITQRITVSGLGGIGKTTTAIWFAQQYQEKYDRILWIDSDEKSLSQSFKKLATDLDVKNISVLDLKELADRSFQILKSWKCLFIFDNAECYIGKDGIKNVLPKFIKNFDVLITSRNKQWGEANGDGEIPQLQLNVFNQKEGVEFMKKHIKHLSKDEELQIDLLCDLLGNLPLALQIAVATLNRNHLLNLGTYINQIKNTPEIIHKTFDSYERTINKTMNISLNLIQNIESHDGRNIGEVAYKILILFGYITPDNVEPEFFLAAGTRELTPFQTIMERMFNFQYNKTIISADNLDDATEILESYSLITRREVERRYTFSIHRLLQQVIRQNNQSLEEERLTQILNCDGFLQYKLIPFSYANENLQNKFPVIKAELIDRLKLDGLLRDRRFKEAVELSKIIKNTLKTRVSEYNYAVCLQKNNELAEFEQVFFSLLDQFSPHESISIPSGYPDKPAIIETNEQLNKSMVMGQLLLTYIEQQDVTKARNFVLKWKHVTLPIIPLSNLISLLNLMSLSNICIQHHEQQKCISFKLKTLTDLPMKLEMYFWEVNDNLDQRNSFTLTHVTMKHCSVDLSVLPSTLKKIIISDSYLINCSKFQSVERESQPNCWEELSLINVFIKRTKSEKHRTRFDISHLISPTLKKLEIIDFPCKCTGLCISLDRLISTKSLHLAECALIFDPNIRIVPIELTLKNVRVVGTDQKIISNLMVNSFLNFKDIQLLSLTGMSIDFIEPIDINELVLINPKAVNWRKGRWIVENLCIFPSAPPTQMNIKQMTTWKELPESHISETNGAEKIKGMDITLLTDFNKKNVLNYLRRISGFKTISGIFASEIGSIAGINRIQKIAGASMGIISTYMPWHTSNEAQWASFIAENISNWKHRRLVRIQWYDGNPIDSIENFTITRNKVNEEARWIDLIKDKGELNKVWKKELDKIAEYLHILQTAGVVTILDFLPRINSNYYIWSGRSGKNGSAKLYQITRDYLTKQHNLTSIIWSWSLSSDYMTQWEEFWPGPGYVDVAAVHMGKKIELSMSEYEKLINVVGEIPISMEGMYTVPSVKLLAAQRRWVWFTANDSCLDNRKYNPTNRIKATFNSTFVINNGHIDFFNEND